MIAFKCLVIIGITENVDNEFIVVEDAFKS